MAGTGSAGIRRLRAPHRRRTYARVGTVASSGILVAATMLTGSSPAAQTAATAAPANTQHVSNGPLGPGHKVSAQNAPARSSVSAAARAAARVESQRHPLAGPAWLSRQASATKSSTTASLGSAVSPSMTTATPISAFRNTAVATGAGFTSTVSEPSTDQSGKNIFQTSNWTAQFSHNNGAAWTVLDPFSQFGPGFCCDQVTAYDPGRDREYWLLQYDNHLTIANSAAGDLSTTGWCSYSINPSIAGRPLTDVFDYNDISIGTNYLYITSNLFDPNTFSGTAVIRLNLDDMTACVGARNAAFVRTDLFTLKPAQGLSDVMYAASDAPNGLTGNTLRVISWDDASGTITTTDKSILPFTYMFAGPTTGGNCASADGIVNNWCQRTDSRVLGGARGNGKLYFSWNVRQGAVGRSFPYTREVTLQELGLGVFSQRDLFSNSFADLYVSMAADRRGHIGYVGTFGGGVGTSHFLPGILTGIVDDFAATFPGDVSFPIFGLGGGCDNPDGTKRWGDYNTARGSYTGAGVWTVTSYVRLENSVQTCGTAVPISLRNIVIGRARDLPPTPAGTRSKPKRPGGGNRPGAGSFSARPTGCTRNAEPSRSV